MSSSKPTTSQPTIASHEQHHDQDPTEQTPLLVGGHLAPEGDTEASALLNNDQPKQQQQPSKPFPKLQIFLLCCLRVPEAVTFFSIFPFIAEMVQRNGHLPESDVGFYSGLVESLFSAVQMVVLIFWGRLADRIGRKPVLLYSFAGLTLSPVLFGVSTTLWQMFLFRCIAGVFSGSALVVRTMIAEHTTPETQARAFSWHAFGGNVGIFLGPVIGGALADPAVQYPRVFKGVHFFEQYPYALAGFAAGAFSLASVIICAFFIEETLEQKKENKPVNGTSDEPPPKDLSMWELIKSPNVGIVLWVYSHTFFLAFAFTAIMPVALYIRPSLGGIGFSPSMISAWMAVQGGSQALWLLFAFPFLQRRMGTKGVMKACGIAWPFFFSGYVVLNALLRDGSQPAITTFWIVGALVSLIGPGVAMAFTGAQLALNDVTPNPRILGTLNAIAMTGASGIRAVIPGVSTAVYAIGVRNQILKGHLAWAILIPIAAALAIFASMLPEGKKAVPETEDEEST